MGYLAIVGDRATTTALAVASAWPRGEVAIVEADPSGGSLAAWLGLPASPSLSTAVARTSAPSGLGGRATRSAWSTIEPLLQPAGRGVRVLVAPMSGREASRTVTEAGHAVLPCLAQVDDPPAILVDAGQLRAGEPLPATVRMADRLLVCHRQEPASAAAASVRLQRLAELLGTLDASHQPVVAVIGDDPYDTGEIAAFVDDQLERWGSLVRPRFVPIADDAPSAAVLAGRSGMSAKRLGRRPLVRSCADLAELLCAAGDLLGESA